MKLPSFVKQRILHFPKTIPVSKLLNINTLKMSAPRTSKASSNHTTPSFWTETDRNHPERGRCPYMSSRIRRSLQFSHTNVGLWCNWSTTKKWLHIVKCGVSIVVLSKQRSKNIRLYFTSRRSINGDKRAIWSPLNFVIYELICTFFNNWNLSSQYKMNIFV